MLPEQEWVRSTTRQWRPSRAWLLGALPSMVLVSGALGGAGCGDAPAEADPPSLEFLAPNIAVQADRVQAEVRVGGPTDEVQSLRFVVFPVGAAVTGPVASGELTYTKGGTYRGDFPLDAEGIYRIQVSIVGDGGVVAEDTQDFKYRFVPAPLPVLPGVDEGRISLRVPTAPHRHSLVIETEPDIRIEVTMGDLLLGRTVAESDRVKLEIELPAGENTLMVRAWRGAAFAEKAVTVEVVVGGPPRSDSPQISVRDLCDQERVSEAWTARRRLRTDPAGSTSLTNCLIAGAAEARASREITRLIGESTVEAQLSLRSLMLGAEAHGRLKEARARDRLWAMVVSRIAGRGTAEMSAAEATAVGVRMKRSGADTALLKPCHVHRDAQHPCVALQRGLLGDQRPPPIRPVAPGSSDPQREVAAACRQNAFREAARRFAAAADADLLTTRAIRLCVAIGLRQSGDCRAAIEIAKPLVEPVVFETAAAVRSIATCQAANGDRDDAADSWRQAIGHVLSGRTKFLVSTASVRRSLDRAGLDDAQRARAVEPCGAAPNDALCKVLVDAPMQPPPPPMPLSELCRTDQFQAAAAHADAEKPPLEHASCVARGHLELGSKSTARTILSEALGRMKAGPHTGEAARTLARISSGREKTSAMTRAVEMVAQSLYVLDDEAAFYREIESAGGSGRALQLILAPCRDARERDACRALLAHFDRSGGAQGEASGAGSSAASAVVGGSPPDGATGDAGSSGAGSGGAPGQGSSRVQPDVIVRPIGARFELTVDGEITSKTMPSGAVVLDEAEIPDGPHRFRVVAPGAKTREGTLNIKRRSARSGPIKLRAHSNAAHQPFSNGIAALQRGALPEAIAAFRQATQVDGEFCLAWTYLGYAQGLDGKISQANGSFRRCQDSLRNDLEAVVVADVLKRVIGMNAAIESGSASAIDKGLQALSSARVKMRSLFRVLPSSKRGDVRLGDIHRYWKARGLTALWRAQGAAAQSQETCGRALEAWRELPAARMRIHRGRLTESATSFGGERRDAMAALEAACGG